MNAVGAVTTSVVLVVIVMSKFAKALTVVIAIPLLVALLARIRRRYRRVYAEIAVQPDQVQPVRLPQRHRTDRQSQHRLDRQLQPPQPRCPALRRPGLRSGPGGGGLWTTRIRPPSSRVWPGGAPQVELRLVDSPFASLIQPFVAVVEAEENRYPASTLTIVMPMAIPRYRFDSLLLNQRGHQHAPGTRCPAQPGLHHGALLLAGLIPDRRLQPLPPILRCPPWEIRRIVSCPAMGSSCRPSALPSTPWSPAMRPVCWPGSRCGLPPPHGLGSAEGAAPR